MINTFRFLVISCLVIILSGCGSQMGGPQDNQPPPDKAQKLSNSTLKIFVKDVLTPVTRQVYATKSEIQSIREIQPRNPIFCFRLSSVMNKTDLLGTLINDFTQLWINDDSTNPDDNEKLQKLAHVLKYYGGKNWCDPGFADDHAHLEETISRNISELDSDLEELLILLDNFKVDTGDVE